MSVLIQLYNPIKGVSNVTFLNSNTQYVLNYPCASNDCTPYSVTFQPGKYQIECWGAEGGFTGSNNGGKGAYTYGILSLFSSETLYFYIGEKGKPNGPATFNGGGKGTNINSWYGGSGGGASDVRIIPNNWNEFGSLISRIMVAAGGGGSSVYQEHMNGGNGGSLNGYNGTKNMNTSPTYFLHVAEYGHQTRGGVGAISGEHVSQWSGTNGQIGIGGSPIWAAYGGGGGGGYYGGGGGGVVTYCVGSGAGGSSYISGYFGCDSISQLSSSSNIIHTGDPKHYSGRQFSESFIIDGSESFLHPISGNETGHSGHGCARITILESYSHSFWLSCACELRISHFTLILFHISLIQFFVFDL